jgi:predicted nucleic acid-binding protein
MRAVFLDTVGLVALWERADQWRPAAMRTMASLNSPGIRLLTTPQILLECGNAAARKPYRSEVCLLRRHLASQGNLIVPSDTELEGAWTSYERDTAGGASIVDHISFVVLRRLGITDVFTNDRHFKAAGFNVLF